MTTDVLIVDDSVALRRQLTRIFEGLGLRCFQARDGLEALERMQPGHTISLVVCDFNMPRMNGLEFLEALRAIERDRCVSVMMLSGEADPRLLQRARSLGVRSWVVKPFKEEGLVNTVLRLLGTAPPLAAAG